MSELSKPEVNTDREDSAFEKEMLSVAYKVASKKKMLSDLLSHAREKRARLFRLPGIFIGAFMMSGFLLIYAYKFLTNDSKSAIGETILTVLILSLGAATGAITSLLAYSKEMKYDSKIDAIELELRNARTPEEIDSLINKIHTFL